MLTKIPQNLYSSKGKPALNILNQIYEVKKKNKHSGRMKIIEGNCSWILTCISSVAFFAFSLTCLCILGKEYQGEERVV